MNQPIGIVLVSHSAQLAAGLRELLAQIGSDHVPVAVAGGTDDGGLGTSYDRVVAAIAEADHGAGVIVLPDLGSSVLTTLMVLEDAPRADVLLVDAPFVEGAVAAAVTAASGADLATVAEAARQARSVVKGVVNMEGAESSGPASAQTAAATAPASTARAATTDADTVTATAAQIVSADITLPATLHARPAGRLAQEAAKFTSTIRLEYAGKTVNPTGVLAVMSLGAKLGGTLTVHAEGPDAEAAVKVLTAILADVE